MFLASATYERLNIITTMQLWCCKGSRQPTCQVWRGLCWYLSIEYGNLAKDENTRWNVLTSVRWEPATKDLQHVFKMCQRRQRVGTIQDSTTQVYHSRLSTVFQGNSEVVSVARWVNLPMRYAATDLRRKWSNSGRHHLQGKDVYVPCICYVRATEYHDNNATMMLQRL